MIDFKTAESAELEARKAEILTEMANEGADLDSLESEARELAAEIETRAAAAAAAAETRAKVANGDLGKETKDFKTEENRMSYTVESLEYRNAWLKALSGKTLTTEERDALEEHRSGESLTSATSTAGYAIPTMTANKIIENLVQVYPLIGEIDLMQVPGNVSIAVEATVNAAALHTENASITAADDVLTHITLGGYEIVKLLTVSAKLNTMAIDAFEQWIVSNITRKIGEVIENYIVNGTGSSQPKGIDYADTWSDGTTAVDWAGTAPTIAELIEQVGALNAAYAGNAKWLMNSKTFWTKVVGLRDDKNPGLVDLGAMRILGFPVLLSSKVADDDIFFGDFRQAVIGNLAAPIEVMANANSGFRYNAIDYRGACLFDCTTVAGRVIKSAPTL